MSLSFRPLITEKSAVRLDDGRYVFLAPLSISKSAFKQQLQEVFAVEAIKINRANQPKRTTFFRRRKGQRARYGKFYVQLKQGQAVPGFELKTEKEKK